jgi:hypothetical protein
LSVNDSQIGWNNGNIQSAAGNPLIVGDELFFYCSARQTSTAFWDANMSTGLAKLRRDGFASLNAGAEEGFILTKKIEFSGDHLFVNANTCAGYLTVEVLDASGMTITGFEKELTKFKNCSFVFAIFLADQFCFCTRITFTAGLQNGLKLFLSPML